MFQNVGTPVESLLTKGGMVEDCGAGFLGEEVSKKSGTGGELVGVFQDAETRTGLLFTKGAIVEDCGSGFLGEEVDKRNGTGVSLAGVGSLVKKGSIAENCGAGFLAEKVDIRNGTGVYLAGVSQDEGTTVGFLVMVEGFGGDVVWEELDRINGEAS